VVFISPYYFFLFLSRSSFDFEAKYFRAANSKYTLLLFLFIFTLFIHTLVKEWTMQWTFNHFLLFFISANSHHDALCILYIYILKIEFRRHGKKFQMSAQTLMYKDCKMYK
jgi:hypothetical protein